MNRSGSASAALLNSRRCIICVITALLLSVFVPAAAVAQTFNASVSGIVSDPTGAVAPNPGIIENRGCGIELRREIGGVDAAMRGIDDDRTGGFRPDAGDAVGGDDRSWHQPDLRFQAAAAGPRPSSTSRMPAMIRLRSGNT